MSRVESIQFFVGDLHSEASILAALRAATGIAVESSEFPVSGARGFLQMDEYTEGEFRLGCLVSWRINELEALDRNKLARGLCGALGADILTEMPAPDCVWLLTRCDGSETLVPIREVNVGAGIELAR